MKYLIVLIFSFNSFSQTKEHLDSLLGKYLENQNTATIKDDYKKLSFKEKKWFKHYSCWKMAPRKPDFAFFINIDNTKFLMYKSYKGIAHGYRLVVVNNKECIELETFFEKDDDVNYFFKSKSYWNKNKCCSRVN